MVPRGMGWLLCFAIVGMAIAGCFNPDGGDDPLVNPNLEAVLTTGTTSGSTTGIGSPGTGILSVNPTAVRIPINETMIFTAAGGEPPYTFALISASPNGSITTDGVYTAGATPGSDRIQVTDSAGSHSEADITIYDPSTEATPYQIVCTDVNPPTNAIAVYRSTTTSTTTVNFRIENGTAPDTFNVTNNSGGQPKGYLIGTREGKWEVGQTGANDGSIYDILQVYDSSAPINVAVLKIYVSDSPLTINPTFAVVPSTGNQTFTAPQTGAGSLFWSIPQNQSGGNITQAGVYTPGSSTNGVIGAADTVQVEDGFTPIAQVAQAAVTVPGLSVYPAKAHIRPGNSVVLQALGGSGNYTWTLSQNRSVNTQSFPMTTSSITYTGGSAEGLDIIQLSDGTTGGTISIPVTVCAAVSSRSFSVVSPYFPSSGTIGDYYSHDIAVDDFDGDGIADVVVPMISSSRSPTPLGNFQGSEVAVLMGGTSAGSFASSSTKYTLPNNPGPWGVTTGDYNADGNRDIAVSCYTGGNVVVMFGDGSGGFPNSGTGNLNWITVSLGATSAGPTGITTYNFDRANGDDLVVCDGLGGNVFVLLSRGGGSGAAPGGFTVAATLAAYDPSTTDSVLPRLFDVAVANFNNDTNGSANRTGNGPDGTGWVDIAVTDYSHDYVTIFPATGLTSWSDSTSTSPTQASFVVYNGVGGTSSKKPVGIDVGYFNGATDAYPDIVVANNGIPRYNNNMGIAVLINSGGTNTLNFGTATEYGPYYTSYDRYTSYYWEVVVDDLDNDGLDDIACTSRGTRFDPVYTYYYYTGAMLVWRGLGNGSFYGWTRSDASGTVYRVSGSSYYWHPTGIATIDFGGQTRGTPGAPLTDIIISNACYSTSYAWYGKLVVFENRCN